MFQEMNRGDARGAKKAEKNELPRGWVRTAVGEVYKIVSGGTPATSNSEYWDGDVPWITSADIHGLNDIKPRRRITQAGIENSATTFVPAGSIIVVTRVALGKIALTRTGLCFSQDSQALIGDANYIYPDYALYHLSQAVQEFKFRNQGTTISGVTKKQLASLSFALPPLNEQYRIVAEIEERFTRLDAGVAALKRVQVNFKRFKAAVLKAACEGKLVPQDASDEPASALLERIAQNRKDAKKQKDVATLDVDALPALPRGWCWARVSDVAEVRLGRQRSPSRAVGPHMRPYMRAANVTWNGLDLSDVKEMDFTPKEQETYRLKRGDILLGEASGGISEVGKPAIWNDEIKNCCFQNTLIRVRSEGPAPSYLHIHFYCDALTERFRQIAKGVGIHHLGAENLSNWIVSVPPIAEQHRIVAEVERRLSVAQELETTVATNLARAERLRQAILARAFAGELVPQDPNDEPAEKLLERIRESRKQRNE